MKIKKGDIVKIYQTEKTKNACSTIYCHLCGGGVNKMRCVDIYGNHYELELVNGCVKCYAQVWYAHKDDLVICVQKYMWRSWYYLW